MNVKTIRRIFLMLGLVMMLTVVLAACVDTDSVSELMDEKFSREENNSEVSNDAQEFPFAVINIAPSTVAISGPCSEGATISVDNGDTVFTTESRDGYFIIQADLAEGFTKCQLHITETVGEEEIASYTYVAHYDATADERLDGNSVSIGEGSRLYFDKMVDDASGANLYQASELESIRSYVSDTVTTFYENAGANKAELIYVLVPNATTIYKDIIPEDKYEKPFTTIYDQVANALNNTRATVVDMREIFNAMIADEANAEKLEAMGGLYRVTDSSLTDYGAYLTYQALMNKVAERFPDAAPYAEDQFDWKNVKTMGGNLVDYRDLDKTVITEDIVVSVPKFSLDLGKQGNLTANIASLKKYADVEDGDYGYFTTVSTSDGVNGLAERWEVDTSVNRVGKETTVEKVDEETGETITETVNVLPNLPNALIYRDYSALSFSDILAERFNKSLLVTSGEFSINLTYAGQFAAKEQGKSTVDYIIVILSEDNMDQAFKLAIS